MENGNEVEEETRLPKRGRLPYLVYTLDSERQVVCSLEEEEQPGKKVSLKRIPELQGATKLWQSCYGWIPVLTSPSSSSSSSSLSLFNPATCDTIKLPALHGPTRPRIYIRCFVLSSPPSDPNCLALVLFHAAVDDEDDADNSQVAFCRPAADHSWTVEFYREKLRRCVGDIPSTTSDHLESVTGFSGKLYACTGNGFSLRRVNLNPMLVLIERDEEDGQLKFTSLGISLATFSIHEAWCQTYSLVESSCGELLLVRLTRYGWTLEIADLKVFRLDLSEMKMVEVRSLRDKLFLCSWGSIACPSSPSPSSQHEGGGIGEASFADGDIYLNVPDEFHLYSFSLEQQSLTLHRPWGRKLPLPSGSDRPRAGAARAKWVFPHHHHHTHGTHGTHGIGNGGNNQSPAVVSTALQHTPQETQDQEETSSSSTSTSREEGCAAKTCCASSRHHHDVGSQSQQVNLLLDLQVDCLASIAESLKDLKGYMNFRGACKKLQLALPVPTVPWKTAWKGNIIRVPCPWFMHSKNDDRLYDIIDPARSLTYELQVPQELSGASILCSKEGWLVMSSPPDKGLFYYNPFKGEIGRYPPREDHFNSIMGVGLSSVPPTSSDCITLVMSGLGDPSLTLDFIRLAHDKEWHRVKLDDIEFCAYKNPVFCDGSFFCLGISTGFATFTPSTTNFSESDNSPLMEWDVYRSRPEVVLDLDDDDDDDVDDVYMDGESFFTTRGDDDELLYVFMDRGWQSVQVLRWEDGWKNVESLGNHMLFVDNFSCLSALAEVKGMENKIYFQRYCGPRRSMIFYSMETKRFHSLDDHKVSMEDLFHTSVRTNCCWIEGGGLRLDYSKTSLCL